MAGFAFEGDIGHELHLDRDLSFSFTFFTSSAFLIKGEIGSRIAHLLSQRLLTVKFTDLIVGPDIGHRVGTGTLADGCAYRLPSRNSQPSSGQPRLNNA